MRCSLVVLLDEVGEGVLEGTGRGRQGVGCERGFVNGAAAQVRDDLTPWDPARDWR